MGSTNSIICLNAVYFVFGLANLTFAEETEIETKIKPLRLEDVKFLTQNEVTIKPLKLKAVRFAEEKQEFDLWNDRTKYNVMTLVNRTSKKLYVCVAYDDSEFDCWVSKGYYNVDPGKSTRVAIRTNNATIGFCAYSSGQKLKWYGNADWAFWTSRVYGFQIKAAKSNFPSFCGEYAPLNYQPGWRTADLAKMNFRKTDLIKFNSKIIFTEK